MSDDLVKMLNVHVEGVRHYLHLQIGKPLSKDLVSAPEIALDNLQREVGAAMRDAAQRARKPSGQGNPEAIWKLVLSMKLNGLPKEALSLGFMADFEVGQFEEFWALSYADLCKWGCRHD